VAVIHGNGKPAPGPTDWADVKRRIFAALGPEGVLREFKTLGVKTEGSLNAKGKIECHAMDRPDENASAYLDCAVGFYHAKGANPETLNLIDFALKYGGSRFADWLTTIKHFAALAGVDLDARRDSKGRIIEATYDYTDAAGEVLYQAIRYRLNSGKKDFRQRRPDGKGDWIWDLDGVDRVLYGLPRLAADPSRYVFVVEGEKDADRLNSEFEHEGLPAVATTSPEGANEARLWTGQESLKDPLRDRQVVVIPDNDPAGTRHAWGICKALAGFAASVKLVELPDVGKKGDASDWLDQGHTLDELWTLVADCPAFDPDAPPGPAPSTEAPKDAVSPII